MDVPFLKGKGRRWNDAAIIDSQSVKTTQAVNGFVTLLKKATLASVGELLSVDMHL